MLQLAIRDHDAESRDEQQQALLDAARGGSSSAENELLKIMRPALVRWFEGELRPALRPKADSDDLAQEALLRAFKSLAQFSSPSIGQYRAWLILICDSVLTDARKRYRVAACRALARERSLEHAEPADGALVGAHAPAADARLCAAEATERMDRALAALPEDQRDALVSHALRGESFADIGRRRGRCASTALAAYRRACHRVARNLDET